MDSDSRPKAWPSLPPPLPEVPPTPPPIPQEIHEGSAQVTHRRRERHGRGGHFRRGRMWLIGIFCALRLTDVMLYLMANASSARTDKSHLHSIVITHGLWTTVLLVCMWFRAGWARYVMIAMTLLNVLSDIIWLPDLLMIIPDPVVNAFLIGMTLIEVGIAYALIMVKAVRRLTNSSYA